jgi:hypothetical protein
MINGPALWERIHGEQTLLSVFFFMSFLVVLRPVGESPIPVYGGISGVP